MKKIYGYFQVTIALDRYVILGSFNAQVILHKKNVKLLNL